MTLDSVRQRHAGLQALEAPLRDPTEERQLRRKLLVELTALGARPQPPVPGLIIQSAQLQLQEPGKEAADRQGEPPHAEAARRHFPRQAGHKNNGYWPG
eukprot:CAMPEP_0170497718 /NCGR_PEP_ID=MMETSP0208-20121228/25547_1 /TAXON_ID=197538 /ORGANISM="Strombidium inclinatum, Strain S3" /LENGTH=98 /DNA_ID=CAMNT_0010774621 /DNA_START=215 /DNA_END=512 /DNA_ORIENTATION=-